MILDNPPNTFDWTKNTVSIFYMPIISHAYLIALDRKVPDSILSSSGNLIKLFQNIEIGQETYKLWLNNLVDYLKKDNNLKTLSNSFKNDKYPNEKGPGHIKGNEQNKLLEKVLINGFPLDALINSYIHDRYQKSKNFIFS